MNIFLACAERFVI